MSDINAIQNRTRQRRTPEEKLAALLAQQAELSAQLKAQQKRVAERQAREHAAKVSAIGELVIELLGELPLAELRSKLETLKTV